MKKQAMEALRIAKALGATTKRSGIIPSGEQGWRCRGWGKAFC
jgi:hypothetical protein